METKVCGISKKPALLLAAAAIVLTASAATAASFVHRNSNRVTLNFNRAWRFNGTNGAFSGVSVNDSGSGWISVCLPQENVTVKHMFFNGGKTTGSGAAWDFTSWYRKHYTPPAAYAGRIFLLEFEGVATTATVYVNGDQVVMHQGGYTPFTVDITEKIAAGSDNVIAVQVNSHYQSDVPPECGEIDFCVFGGIVRNVNLHVVDPLHVEWNWVSIPPATSPSSVPSGTVTSHVKLINNAASAKNYRLTTSIVDHAGNVVASGSADGAIDAGGASVITYETSNGSVDNFWSPVNPYLYNVYTQVQDGEAYVDEQVDRTGFRTIYPMSRGTSYSGIYINGTKIKLFGLNRHETFPFIGRAAARRLQRKDADILKYDLGCNTVRCSHYPQASDFLKRCDEIGLMILQEVPGWQHVPSRDGVWWNLLRQCLKEMIYRDRNRPSVISFGVRVNESMDNNSLYGPMNDTARAIDPSRPTHGVRMGGTSSFLEDIWTQNFVEPGAGDNDPWITTEAVGHNLRPQVHSWDNDADQLRQATAHINEQNKTFGNQYSMGRLGWCAFDYNSPHPNATTNEIGGRITAAPYLSPHGVASIFRIPKLAGYLFQSQRDPATCGYMVYIANDRTETSPTTVTVFSNCSTVELFRNGTSLGSKSGTVGPNLPHPVFQWTGVASGGTLRAIGSEGGVSHQVSPPGDPVAIVLTPDDSIIYDGGDMTRVVVSLVDTSGRPIRSRADSITMSATGAGEFVGEARSALEGGQFAFYVKSRDGEYGAVNCASSVIGNTDISPGSATVNVIREASVAQRFTPTAHTGTAASEKTIYRKIVGNRFHVPPNEPENARVSVYDLAGRLLRRVTTQPAQVLDFGKTAGVSNGIYLVKIECGRTAAGKGCREGKE
ncbi:MAG: DUF4982 domain-containing protein [Chitinispirillaceae bacterium]|nr:DUF4982 domain-containing protein [Chitinispirillaceae bacterium]